VTERVKIYLITISMQKECVAFFQTRFLAELVFGNIYRSPVALSIRQQCKPNAVFDNLWIVIVRLQATGYRYALVNTHPEQE
jgi:hypothetical protein